MAARESGAATGRLGGRLSGGSRARAALARVPRLAVVGDFVPLGSGGPAADQGLEGDDSGDGRQKRSRGAPAAAPAVGAGGHVMPARLTAAAPPPGLGCTGYDAAFPPLGPASGAVAALTKNARRGKMLVVRVPAKYGAGKAYDFNDVCALGDDLRTVKVSWGMLRKDTTHKTYKVPYSPRAAAAGRPPGAGRRRWRGCRASGVVRASASGKREATHHMYR